MTMYLRNQKYKRGIIVLVKYFFDVVNDIFVRKA